MPQQQTLPSTSEVDVHEFLQKILFSNDVTDGDIFRQSTSIVLQSPEHELYFAVLEQAWWDYQSNIPREKSLQRRVFDEAFDWFFNEHHVEWECSFEHLCEMFDITPNYVRKGIILWTKRYYSQPLPAPEVTVPKPVVKTYPKFVDISEII